MMLSVSHVIVDELKFTFLSSATSVHGGLHAYVYESVRVCLHVPINVCVCVCSAPMDASFGMFYGASMHV